MCREPGKVTGELCGRAARAFAGAGRRSGEAPGPCVGVVGVVGRGRWVVGVVVGVAGGAARRSRWPGVAGGDRGWAAPRESSGPGWSGLGRGRRRCRGARHGAAERSAVDASASACALRAAGVECRAARRIACSAIGRAGRARGGRGRRPTGGTRRPAGGGGRLVARRWLASRRPAEPALASVAGPGARRSGCRSARSRVSGRACERPARGRARRRRWRAARSAPARPGACPVGATSITWPASASAGVERGGHGQQRGQGDGPRAQASARQAGDVLDASARRVTGVKAPLKIGAVEELLRGRCRGARSRDGGGGSCARRRAERSRTRPARRCGRNREHAAPDARPCPAPTPARETTASGVPAGDEQLGRGRAPELGGDTARGRAPASGARPAARGQSRPA